MCHSCLDFARIDLERTSAVDSLSKNGLCSLSPNQRRIPVGGLGNACAILTTAVKTRTLRRHCSYQRQSTEKQGTVICVQSVLSTWSPEVVCKMRRLESKRSINGLLAVLCVPPRSRQIKKWWHFRHVSFITWWQRSFMYLPRMTKAEPVWACRTASSTSRFSNYDVEHRRDLTIRIKGQLSLVYTAGHVGILWTQMAYRGLRSNLISPNSQSSRAQSGFIIDHLAILISVWTHRDAPSIRLAPSCLIRLVCWDLAEDQREATFTFAHPGRDSVFSLIKQKLTEGSFFATDRHEKSEPPTFHCPGEIKESFYTYGRY